MNWESCCHGVSGMRELGAAQSLIVLWISEFDSEIGFWKDLKLAVTLPGGVEFCSQLPGGCYQGYRGAGKSHRCWLLTWIHTFSGRSEAMSDATRQSRSMYWRRAVGMALGRLKCLYCNTEVFINYWGCPKIVGLEWIFLLQYYSI